MFTTSDFAKLAQAKAQKKAAIPAPTTVAGKAKSMAEAVKEAVTASFPATHRVVDQRTEQLLVLYAGLEQRVENVERHTQCETTIDIEKAAVRAGSLMEQFKAYTETEKQAKAEAKAPEAPTPAPEVVVLEAPVRTKPKGIRFDDIPKMQ